MKLAKYLSPRLWRAAVEVILTNDRVFTHLQVPIGDRDWTAFKKASQDMDDALDNLRKEVT